jgi:predicted HAD superfamily Cof-like phosphohydrolase
MSVSKYQLLVRGFHKAMNCQYGWHTKELRKSLILEEATETARAMEAEDPIELLDGICDLLYVLYGTADVLGLEVPEMAIETIPPLQSPMGTAVIKSTKNALLEAIDLIIEELDRERQKELSDCLYNLVLGCWLVSLEGLGMELAPFFEEVHRTNMLKLTGPVREDGKRLKPPGWKPPRIADMYAKRKGMPCSDDTP